MTYGAGCITIKHIRRHDYVYVELSMNGCRTTKYCGNAAKRESHELAQKILEEHVHKRIDELGRKPE